MRELRRRGVAAMTKLIKLHATDDTGTVLYVAPVHIVAIAKNGIGTDVVLDGGMRVNVSEECDAIVEMVQQGGM